MPAAVLELSFAASDATRFLPDGENALIPPFVSIPGLGESAAQDLMSCRDKGKTFLSVVELSAACPNVSQTHLETLRQLGALGSLPATSQITLFDF